MISYKSVVLYGGGGTKACTVDPKVGGKVKVTQSRIHLANRRYTGYRKACLQLLAALGKKEGVKKKRAPSSSQIRRCLVHRSLDKEARSENASLIMGRRSSKAVPSQKDSTQTKEKPEFPQTPSFFRGILDTCSPCARNSSCSGDIRKGRIRNPDQKNKVRKRSDQRHRCESSNRPSMKFPGRKGAQKVLRARRRSSIVHFHIFIDNSASTLLCVLDF